MTPIQELKREQFAHNQEIKKLNTKANKKWKNTKTTIICFCITIIIVGLSYYMVKACEKLNTKALENTPSKNEIRW
jgi:Tfp pilus assembly protein PilO